MADWRVDKAKEEKVLEDSVPIKEKAEAHRKVYEEERQKRLSSGFRFSRTKGRLDTTTQTESYAGPEFAIVIKGIYICVVIHEHILQ